MTKAYGEDYAMDIYVEDPDPFEIEVRGIPALITRGFCTYAIRPAGSLFWSETGFRSFGINVIDRDEVAECIETHLAKSGKIERWWPRYVLWWRQSLAFELEMTARLGRANIWDQWGPEKHAEAWANHDAKQAEHMAHMLADGIDPNEVQKPVHFKGKWPRFDIARLAA
ncbi:MAG: hypothetical protein QM647_15185 [Asticcacaulis sp.]|uniref:hypothetical protein n=1 Tax=Asticcacaulis sp. TaxID=1872648 RepID=UPI0039E28C9C